MIPGANISFVDKLDAQTSLRESVIQPQYDQISDFQDFQQLLRNDLAGTQGFEPRYADPESAVLPLDDVPTVLLF